MIPCRFSNREGYTAAWSLGGIDLTDEETNGRKLPSIVIVGIGGGGSRILSEGLEKIVRDQEVDRYGCLTKAIKADTDKPQHNRAQHMA